ncbi:hypothetical protein EJ08DRAFT_660974 [Tothia fuscella]|uniref:Myb-like domain-containing protein n=1 Tax=Tothia fuscella TaxID=1048955 RepID=A0A9P4NRC9_9PEZI|nr:hypothetical protein EJ08DRAFT_660974 [Tothia fuscella]
MPKDYHRPPSTSYRHTPLTLPSDTHSTHPQTHSHTLPSLHPTTTTTTTTTANTTRVTSIWSTTDDETLMSARASGLNWQPIATKYFPSKTANACRKRHERLMERRNAEQWDGVKLEVLAKEYMGCRREMWGLLAERLSKRNGEGSGGGGSVEKWQVIEDKCFEKGLKNLQAAFKSSLRKERAERGMDPEEDSGIAFSDAEFETIDATAMGESSRMGGRMSGGSLMSGTSDSLGIDSSHRQHHMHQNQQSYGYDNAGSRGGSGDGVRGRNMSIQSMLSPSPPAEVLGMQ